MAIAAPNDWLESFGLVAVEAMACGKPVVATRQGGLAETVVHEQTGVLAETRDTDALGAALLAYMEDDSRVAAHGAAARRRCEERFDIRRCAADYASLFRGLNGPVAHPTPWRESESEAGVGRPEGASSLRVLCLTNMYPTESDQGTGSFVRDVVEGVRDLGVHVEVLAFDGRKRKRAYAEAALMLRRALRRERFDLVHAHYGLTGMVALAQRKVPTVVTFHGSDVGYVRWQGWVSWLVARCTTPVFVSLDGAQRLGCSDATIIPEPVGVDLFRPRPAEDARKSLGWPVRGHYVLLPGARSNLRKGPELFDSVVDRLRAQVPDLTAVSLEGFTRTQVVDVMNAVDVTLMTSLFEGSPVAAKESLACMTPVVSVPVGDMRELLAGLPGCAIAPRSPGALAEAVLEAFERGGSPALRRRAESFSGALIARRTVDVYRGVLDG